MGFRSALLVSVCVGAWAAPALAQTDTPSSDDEGVSATETADSEQQYDANVIVVTAQKQSETVQSVPISVSAFDEGALRDRGVDSTSDLVLAVPNMVYQSGSVQLRGIGTQISTVAGDDGVGLHRNGAPVDFPGEYYDIERVEVLRGPQGTLYGRSATGGVVNVITNKPTRDASMKLSMEVGNYGNMRAFGHGNLPLGDALSVRLAGFILSRDGYTTNTLNGDSTDGRYLWSTRASLGFDNGGPFRAYAMWEHYTEDDDRGSNKVLCKKDPGLTSVRGVPTGAAQVAFTQGCLQSSVYADDTYEATNTLATFSGILARQLGIQPQDSFAGKTISRDLREIELAQPTIYQVNSDIFQLGAELDVTDAITLTSLTNYSTYEAFNRFDSTSGYSSVTFPNSPLVPTGVITNAQLGTSDRLQLETILAGEREQFSQEFRVMSSFDGPLNFNLGGIYIDNRSEPITYINSNPLEVIAGYLSAVRPGTIYIDPLQNPAFTGHQYFASGSTYDLESIAAMGELYFEPSDNLKVTLGLRYTEDEKTLVGTGSTLMVPGSGLVFNAPQNDTFRALTGRFNVSYTPDLAFTDDSLFFLSYARGYKGGGFNSPGVVALGLAERFEPELVNGYEAGMKNLLADGKVMLNLTGFYYDYTGYQIARRVNRSSFVENIDTRVYGLEFEGAVEPFDGLRLNANIGYLGSEITEGQAVDTFYRNLGDDTYIYANSTVGGCILNAQGVADALAVPGGAAVLANVACSGPATVGAGLAGLGLTPAQAAALASGIYNYGPDVALYSSGAGEGVLQDLTGNELPNAPSWTISLGAQYTIDLGESGWAATLRGDYYRQSSSFSRYNNAFFDKIQAWENVNATLTFDNRDIDLKVQFYVKNALNNDTIYDYYINDENLGSFRNLQILDPRLFGFLVTKAF